MTDDTNYDEIRRRVWRDWDEAASLVRGLKPQQIGTAIEERQATVERLSDEGDVRIYASRLIEDVVNKYKEPFERLSRSGWQEMVDRCYRERCRPRDDWEDKHGPI